MAGEDDNDDVECLYMLLMLGNKYRQWVIETVCFSSPTWNISPLLVDLLQSQLKQWSLICNKCLVIDTTCSFSMFVCDTQLWTLVQLPTWSLAHLCRKRVLISVIVAQCENSSRYWLTGVQTHLLLMIAHVLAELVLSNNPSSWS